jgi:sec-independent protein translocase protein TatB
MFDIGFMELVLVGIIALLVLGPERLPKAARAAGAIVGKAKRMATQFSQELDRQMKAEELRERLKKEGDGIGLKDIERSVQEALSEANEVKQMADSQIIPPETTPASDVAQDHSPKTPSSTPQPADKTDS